MPHLTYLEAAVTGLIQGVSELFPVSSLGHNVLIPAVIGGSWARDLNVASAPAFLAFVVGLHVATALALLLYFRRDWARIIGGFFSSVARLQVETRDQKLAWMIVIATIPVGLAGLALDHAFRLFFGVPIRAAAFLVLNGVILIAGERFRRRRSLLADRQRARERELAAVGGRRAGRSRHASGHQAVRAAQAAEARESDMRLARQGYPQALVIGAAQILALLAGISRDGVAMVAGMARGLCREDAARFAFLLATPVILAAGAFKARDLVHYGHGIYGPILLGSLLSGAGAYVSVRFLVRYFRTRTLTPFGIYCVVAGGFCLIYLGVVR
jgi:undecaprenyl-diphosphatase